MELKNLRNLTEKPQAVFVFGRQFVLSPYEEAAFEPGVADRFLQDCQGLVQEVLEDIGGTYKPTNLEQEEFIWVANMTGNPDAPETIPVKKSAKGVWFTEQALNPVKEPRVLRENMKGGMQEYHGISGLLALNLFPIEITLPPYKRVKLKKNLAQFVLNRAAHSDGGRRCIRSREIPRDMEPGLSWPLDTLRAYLAFMDPSADVGQRERTMRNWKKYTKKKGQEKLLEQEIVRAKELLLKRLHFRLSDPKYREPPLRSELDAFAEHWLGAEEERLSQGKKTDQTPPDPEDIQSEATA